MAVVQTTAKKITARERESEAIRLRKLGYNYEKIGHELGITRGAAYKCVKRAMKKIIDEYSEDARSVRELSVQRCVDLIYVYYPLAVDGSAKATELLLKVERRLADLTGADAPTKVGLDDQTSQTFTDWMQRLTREPDGGKKK